jgi:hypothetical protein
LEGESSSDKSITDQLLHQRWGTLRPGARRDCEVPAIRGRNGTRVWGMVNETILRILKVLICRQLKMVRHGGKPKMLMRITEQKTTD